MTDRMDDYFIASKIAADIMGIDRIRQLGLTDDDADELHGEIQGIARAALSAAEEYRASIRAENERLRKERDAQYEENVERIAKEGAAILRAEAAESLVSDLRKEVERKDAALNKICLQDRVTRNRGTESQFYEDGPCGKIARAALSHKEDKSE